jgi:hypothetical protein
LWRNLKSKAGTEGSPFVQATGTDRGKLVTKNGGATLSSKTLATAMPEIRRSVIAKRHPAGRN